MTDETIKQKAEDRLAEIKAEKQSANNVSLSMWIQWITEKRILKWVLKSLRVNAATVKLLEK